MTNGGTFDPLKGKSHVQQTLWRYPDEVHRSRHWAQRNSTVSYTDINSLGVPHDTQYTFNNYGFRTAHDQEFYYAWSPIAVGCSITLGVGVKLDQTWHSHIDTSCNLGQDGGTVETVYRLLQYWVPKIRPARVRVLAPPMGRREVWTEESRAVQFSPSNPSEHVLPKLLSTETEIRINADHMKSAILHICSQHKAPCTYVEWEDIAHLCVDYSADGVHPGRESHQAIATYFKNKEKDSQ